MNPWDHNHNDIQNMTTYLSANMFQMRIDPNAQATSEEQYKDVDKSTVKEEATVEAASNGHTEESGDANTDPPAAAAPEVKQETPATPVVAESNPGNSNNGEIANNNAPSVPPGVPTSESIAVPVSAVAAPVANEQVIEEHGEVSMLYVGRVIGKGGEVRLSCFAA